MPIEQKIREGVQLRLMSSVELVRSTLEPYGMWVRQTLGVPLAETITLEVDSNPGDAIAVQLLEALPIVANTKARTGSWGSLIERWVLPSHVSPRVAVSLQRQRNPSAAPAQVWEPEWKDCPLALKLKGLAHPVISVKMPTHFPPCEYPFRHVESQHWLIVHREDATQALILIQQVCEKTERYLETAYGRTRLHTKYDWDSVLLDETTQRMVRTDFELFFGREEWFRQHNLPYRRGYLLWGSPGNGKSATIRIMAAHPYIQPYALDLSDLEKQNSDIHLLFEQAAANTPALIILEDLDRAFPNEGKRTNERSITFQTFLNCLDGVGTQDGIIVVATANDPTLLDAAILKRPGRFDRVVHFRNPDADLRRHYYRKLSPVLSGGQFEPAIEKTDGFSFAQLRETYIMGAQSAFEHARQVVIDDIFEAIELQTSGAYELKKLDNGSGFVHSVQPASNSAVRG